MYCPDTYRPLMGPPLPLVVCPQVEAHALTPRLTHASASALVLNGGQIMRATATHGGTPLQPADLTLAPPQLTDETLGSIQVPFALCSFSTVAVGRAPSGLRMEAALCLCVYSFSGPQWAILLGRPADRTVPVCRDVCRAGGGATTRRGWKFCFMDCGTRTWGTFACVWCTATTAPPWPPRGRMAMCWAPLAHGRFNRRRPSPGPWDGCDARCSPSTSHR